MKAKYFILASMFLGATVQAKTYTISSGEWTNPSIWANNYMGTTIKAGDVVIITGRVVLDEAIIVQGLLQIEKGGSLIGMQALSVAHNGSFVNNGITVVQSIENEGAITNNLLMKAIMDNENNRIVENSSTIIAGDNCSNETAAPGSSNISCANNETLNTYLPKLHLYLTAPEIKDAEVCTY